MAAEAHGRNHRIRKVVFDLRFPDENQAFTARKRLEDAFYQTIVPLLEEVFDAHAPPGQVYRLPRLEIDLGVINPARLDGDRIARIIRRQLGRRLRELPAGEIAKQPVDLALEETFLRFLETGSWPWSSVYQGVTDLEESWEKLTGAASRRLFIRLWPLLRHRQVRLRLAQQFSPRFFSAVIDMLQPDTAASLRRIGQTVLGDWETIACQEVLLAVAAEISLDATVPAAALEEKISRAARKHLSAVADASLSTPNRVWEFPPEASLPLEGVHPLEGTLLAEAARPSEPSSDAAQKEEMFYVRHAGIVLLHPFLARFFHRLGLLADPKRFASTASLIKAVHLLYFLATGEENPEEPETVLFKVLCGFPVNAPLPRHLPLNRQEKEEAEAMLTAAVRHWQKLRNTSPTGLREAFLQREGKLTVRSDGWKLVVEARGLDVLLDFLPWSLSVVRLPWMESPIYVDWA